MVNRKQDRQGVRTPTDVERKYNLGKSTENVTQLLAIVNKQSQSVSQLGQMLSQYIVNTNARISVLEDAILPQLGAVFCSVTEKSLADFGLIGNTLCVVVSISDMNGETSYEDLSSSGEYRITLRLLGDDTTITLDIDLQKSATLTIGGKAYLTEQSETLCLAYAV